MPAQTIGPLGRVVDSERLNDQGIANTCHSGAFPPSRRGLQDAGRAGRVVYLGHTIFIPDEQAAFEDRELVKMLCGIDGLSGLTLVPNGVAEQ